ncbi:MAG: ankyrin repeat domain-containing protein [Planctomycetes bacterium]|nr:ankyrin repeat domain-containing protein [Planctomycetota bacterium]
MAFIPSCLFLLAIGPSSGKTEPYDSALIAAVHHFVVDGELDHLKAILEKHPNLVDSTKHFRQPRKPVRTDSFTPLRRAAYFGREKVAAYLVSRGANVNLADGRGWTPLHLAARRGHLSVVKLLIKRGADRHAKTTAIPERSGPFPGARGVDRDAVPEVRKTFPAIPSRTPLEWAVALNQTKVVDYLKSLRTSPNTP